MTKKRIVGLPALSILVGLGMCMGAPGNHKGTHALDRCRTPTGAVRKRRIDHTSRFGTTAWAILPTGRIRALSADQSGTLLAYDRKGCPVTAVQGSASDAVRVIQSDARGRVLVAAGQKLFTLNSHRLERLSIPAVGLITALAFYGDRVLIGERSGTLRFGRLQGRTVHFLHTANGAHLGSVNALVTTASTKGIAFMSGGEGGILKYWSADGQTLARRRFASAVTALAALPPGGTEAGPAVAVGLRNGKVRTITKPGTPGTLRHRIPGAITALGAGPQGSLLVGDGLGRLRLLRPGQKVLVLVGHNQALKAVALQGNRIWSAGLDNTLKLWTRNGQPLGHRVLGHRDAVQSVRFMDGQIYAGGGTDGNLTAVRRWDPLRGHMFARSRLLREPVRRMAARRGTLVVSSGSTLLVLNKGLKLRTRFEHPSGLTALSLGAGARQLWTGDRHGYARRYSLRGRLLGRKRLFKKGITSMTWNTSSGSRARLAVGTWDGRVAVYRIAGGTGRAQTQLKLVRTYGKVHRWVVSDLSWGDRGRLAAASWDRRVTVLSADGKVSRCHGHTDWVRAVAFDPRGEWLASAGDDAVLRVWRPGDCTALRVLHGPAGRIFALSSSADGQLLAAGAKDHAVHLWTRRELAP